VRIHREFATTTVFVTHDQEEAMSIADRTAVLRDGTLQQIDTPLNLYNRPATQWVAQFVGTYKINLLDAQRAKSEDGFALELQLGGQTFACECRDKDAIRRLTTSMHGRRCRIGVRPEHVSLSPPGTNGTALRGEIFTRQVLGKEILYDVTVADTHLRAVVPAKHLYDLGEPVELTFNWQEMLFFDAETGHALNV
jgi:ABC-type sugar transport system ATPase subunit